jgi:quinol monooxygenase YgiN
MRRADARVYALHRGLDDRSTFVMIERYDSKGHLDQHMGSAYIQNLFANIGDLVDGPPELLFLEPLTDSMGVKGRI